MLSFFGVLSDPNSSALLINSQRKTTTRLFGFCLPLSLSLSLSFSLQPWLWTSGSTSLCQTILLPQVRQRCSRRAFVGEQVWEVESCEPMRKHNRGHQCSFPLENSHPGCALNILHIIKYHHWRYVKRRYVTSKRNAMSRHVPGFRNPGNDTNGSSDDKMQGYSGSKKDYCIIEEKMTESIPAPKNSVKARIKALISEEMCIKKGKHHRSSSYPVRSLLTRSDSIHHLEPSDTDPLAGFLEDNGSPTNVRTKHEHSSSISTLDSLPPDLYSGDKSYEEPGTIFTGQLPEPNQVDEYEEQPTENHTLLEEKLVNKKQDTSAQKLIHAKELTRMASFRTKKFLDALDLSSVSKSLLLEILEDPSSPLAPNFQNQHALNQKRRLCKSGSFPSPGWSGRRRSGRSKTKHTQEEIGFHAKEKCGQSPTSGELRYSGDFANQLMRYRAKNEVDGIPRPNPKPVDMRESQMAIKRFRDLRKKIKHVIKESRKERHRITMDAVLHKIPHGRGYPSELKKDDFNQPKDPAINRQGNANLGSSDGMRRMRRTSSLNRSMDRYCQLYETTLNKESKNQTSERVTFRTEETSSSSGSAEKPSLTRVLSLPSLTSCIYQSRNLSDLYSSGVMSRTLLDGPASMGSSFDERISVDLPTDSESQLQLDSLGEVGLASVAKNEENDKGSLILDNVGNLTAATVNSSHEDIEGDIIRAPKESMAELEEAIPVSLTDSTNPEQFSVPEDSEENGGLPDRQDNLALAEGEVEQDRVELQNNLSGYEIQNFQADEKEKAEFAFVSDVLELYGFRGDESPETWHCDDHPTCPLVYEEEVEGCLLPHPDCTTDEACGNFNHLLLFDLIKEVVTDIYKRSYSYYPKRLSSLAHIRPMPAGRHVLKEVWALISSYLSTSPGVEQSIDYAVSRDLATNDGWMNLQFDIECAALELEDLILDDLLEEVFET